MRMQLAKRPVEAGMIEWWRGRKIHCPPHLRAPLERAVDARHHNESRFLSVVALLFSVASLILDVVSIPDHAAAVAALRLSFTIPVFCFVLLTPSSHLALSKVLLGMGLCGLAVTMLLASSYAHPPENAFMAIGVLVMFGLAIPLLPFRRRGMLFFIGGTVITTGSLVLHTHGSGEFARTYLVILVLVAVAAGILSRRIRWLEKRTILLTLQAEDRAGDLEQSNRRLTELSMQDPLTDLANRRWAEKAFERHYALSPAEAPGQTAILLIDIDRFKEINDRWGHDVGDRGLQAVAEVLRHAASGTSGLAARFGGEEFVILLRVDGPGEARRFAEEVRASIERIEIEVDSPPRKLGCTVSIGVVVHAGEEKPSLSKLLKRADKVLYQAKSDGRNRSVLSGIAA